jgi:hypothetical protein
VADALLPESADQDVEARLAIWKSICICADDVRHRFRVKAVRELDGREIRSGSNVPSVETWQLIEALSLLCVVVRCEEAIAKVVSVFGKMGPIEIHEDGTTRYMWAQHTLRGDRSALGGRPDIVVTTSVDSPNPGNASRIIEAKCIKELSTPAIRAEFGKAYDLRVETYFIWSFYSPTQKAIDGAKGLGIDLQALGFDTARRRDLVTNPDALIAHVRNSQDQARRSQRFALGLEGAGQDARRKLLGPAG